MSCPENSFTLTFTLLCLAMNCSVLPRLAIFTKNFYFDFMHRMANKVITLVQYHQYQFHVISPHILYLQKSHAHVSLGVMLGSPFIHYIAIWQYIWHTEFLIGTWYSYWWHNNCYNSYIILIMIFIIIWHLRSIIDKTLEYFLTT